jgi:hypothetical protein
MAVAERTHVEAEAHAYRDASCCRGGAKTCQGMPRRGRIRSDGRLRRSFQGPSEELISLAKQYHRSMVPPLINFLLDNV